ncbi:Spermidine export protein MdtJ [compost metagenome]
MLITLISVTWLGESIGLLKAAGLGVMIAGILLIKAGTRAAPAKREMEALPC